MVKVKELVTRNSCQKKAYYLEGKLDTQKTYHYHLGLLLSSLVKETDFLNLSEEEVSEKFEEVIPKTLFVNEIEYQEQKDIFLIRFDNMTNHLSANYEIIKQNVFGNVELDGKEISLSGLVLLKAKTTEEKFLATFKSSKMKLTLRGKKEETMPVHSIELAAIQMLSEKLFKESITPMFVTLKSRNGNASDTVFEDKPTQNIIQYHFAATNLTNIKEKMKDLLNLTINKDSERCISSDCDNCPFLAMCQPTSFKEPIKKVKNKKEILKELDLTKGQEELIFSEKGIIRANAGAGAGKTTVIAARYLNMIASSNIKSEEMLLITYTRKGAEEMKKRINELAPAFYVKLDKKKLRISTFHEFCQDFITKNKKLFGYKKDVKIASIAENMDLANKTIMNVEGRVSFFRYNNPKLDMYNAKGALLQLVEWMEYIRDMKSRDETFKYISSEFLKGKEISTEDQEVLLNYYKFFEEKRKEEGLLQYDVLLSEMMEILHLGKVKASQLKYKHIMIDEAQDTDDYQLEIIINLVSLLKENFKSLLLIGDDAQSIFSFRKTSTSNFIHLGGIFEELKDIHLSENFRSVESIVNLGNEITSLNKEKIDKVSIAVKKDNKDKPKLIIFDDDKEEHNYIVDSIKKDILNGIKLSEIAVIARKNAELETMHNLLLKNNIPSIIITPQKITKRTSTQAFISLAKVLTSLPEERTAKEVFEAFSIFMTDVQKPEHIEILVNEFMDKVVNEYDNVSVDEKKLFVDKYFEELLKLDMTLEALKVKTNKMSTNELLEYLIVIDEYNDDISYSIDESIYDGVILTTIHTSKGKEFESVYHTVSGYSSRADNSDEENNLLFVAVTRAKTKLKITATHKKSSPVIYNSLNALVRNKKLDYQSKTLTNSMFVL